MKFANAFSTVLLATAATASVLPTDQVKLQDDSLNVPGQNPLTYCADPANYLLHIDNVDLTPNPPVPGQKLAISAHGTVAEAVEKGATAHITVQYGFIQILSQTADLCDTTKNVGLECPLGPGPLSLTKGVDIPKAIPPGTYTVLADVRTKDQKQITCLKASVSFHAGGAAKFIDL